MVTLKTIAASALSLAARMLGARRAPVRGTAGFDLATMNAAFTAASGVLDTFNIDLTQENLMTRPLPATGIADPKDLCNGVYNEDPRLANLAWDDPKFQAALNYIERNSGAEIKEWDSLVNPGANGAPDLRTSTFARFVKFGQFYDADVRQIYLTPYSVLVAIWQITTPKVPMPQFQPFVFEAETAGASPVGEEIKPPIRGWATYKNTSATARVGDVYTDKSGDEWRCDRYFMSGFFGRPGIEYLYWEKKYDR